MYCIRRKHLFSGYDEIAELLIQSNANVNAIGLRGTTALILAAMRGENRFFKHIFKTNFEGLSFSNDVMIVHLIKFDE